MQHRNVATLSDKTRQSAWKLAGDFISIVPIWEAPKYASSSAGQSSLNKFVQQDQSVTNFRVTLLYDRLAVVSTTPRKKAANFNGRRIPCQLGRAENFCCAYKDLRCGDEEPGFLQFDGRQALANTLGKGRTTAHEYRHIGAQGQTQFGQAIFALSLIHI